MTFGQRSKSCKRLSHTEIQTILSKTNSKWAERGYELKKQQGQCEWVSMSEGQQRETRSRTQPEPAS